jgi:tetratricopeptide (TPR) repeat protein
MGSRSRSGSADPGVTRAQAHALALVDLRRGDFRAARRRLDRLARADPTDLQARINLAHAVQGLGDWRGAITAWRDVLKLRPGDRAASLALAADLTVLGRVDEAKLVYRNLAKSPDERLEALARLAVLDSSTISQEERLYMSQQATAGGADRETIIGAWFGLGFAREQIGEISGAFDAFAEGNRLRRATLFDPDPATAAREHAASIDFVRRTFTASFMAQYAVLGDKVAQPIFIVGSPRTGSTLLEQRLADATGGYALGETSAFLRAVGGRWPFRQDALPDPGGFGAVAAEYLAGARAAGWKGRGPTIDKMLDNDLLVGMIALAFPSAVILRCVRDLADTGLAIFRQPFAGPGNECAFDLEDIGHELARREGLMAHWREVLPGRVIEIAYEDLVARPIEVIGALPIPLLESRRRTSVARPVRTASAAEVRRPVHQGPIGRWRLYGDRLEPLLGVFRRAGLTA